MSTRIVSHGCAWALALAAWFIIAEPLAAAPRIANVSLRGVQAGASTSLVVDGDQLGPATKVWFSAPGASPTIKEGATGQRVEIDLKLDAQTPSGIYLLRMASASGISAPVAIAVDALGQAPFAPQMSAADMAMTGELTGSTVLTTTFAGKKDQPVTIEVESHRLGSKLDPVVHLYDARRVQLAWSQGLASIDGDARCSATLPADGTYTIEIHDALYRGASPGFFRLKVGNFRFADMVFPLAVQRGASATFEFAGTNLPAEARASSSWAPGEAAAQVFEPAPWPASEKMVSGSRPVVIVSDLTEVIEPAPSDKAAELPVPPLALNGRLAATGEQDRYRLAVTPGARLRVDVLAHRAGSPLDGVLSIQNEQGAELAGSDDRPGTTDPGLDFTVPEKVQAVVLVLRDLEGRGGADYLYRIAVTPIGPDYSLSLADNAYLVPKDGAALARVSIERAGYDGPVKLNFANLPPSVSITGDEIPAGAVEALVTLSAPGLDPVQGLTSIVGTSTQANTSIKRAALIPEIAGSARQPWLRSEAAVAVTNPAPIALTWDLFSGDTTLAQASSLPVKFRVGRTEGTKGAVRLSLLTTQRMPTKTVKENNQDKQVDDVERAIRFDAAPTIAADQTEVAARVVVPADLPQIAYDLAVQAELLSEDGKQVLAAVVTPARRVAATAPMNLELAGQDPIEARAGLGPTGKLVGKLNRAVGFALPVTLTLEGLPKELDAPSVVVAGDQSSFELPVAFDFGAPAGDLPNVRLVATSQPDSKNPKLIIRSNELPVAIKVVAGDPPPPEQPLAIFEDQVEFLANLNQGGGQASLIADQKYSGLASIKITPDQKLNPALPGLGIKIRKRPAAGEYRYLQFAWKKQGGQAICLQLNHDGAWGPSADKPAKFRYHAGPGPECFGASVSVDANLPGEFVVVTRDLFADFGEFTLTGIALTAADGEFALFDHIYLGTKPADFELVKPK